ncbi:DUF6114 domain-containing protein [Plantactinospora siamensis]|uniref:DUF6114 domain-containing protein n=1 Tax=Plantactinospora siamensis TaxID=555372 RepID=A0ABV6P238_9ACTN
MAAEPLDGRPGEVDPRPEPAADPPAGDAAADPPATQAEGDPPAAEAAGDAKPPDGAGHPAATTGSGSVRLAWRSWRRSRPFWGALLVILGAAEILTSVRAPLPVILHVGPQGLAAYLVPLMLLLCGVLLLVNPAQRLFYSVLAVVLALASWLTSNLGGFLVGLLLGILGGALAFAWTPIPGPGGAGRRDTAGAHRADPA